jgi:hypothetical protein
MVRLWRRTLTHAVSKAVVTSRKTAPVSLFPSKFLLILSIRRAVCSVVLCLGRNPNCSWLRKSHSFISRRTLVSRIFSKRICQQCQLDVYMLEEGSVGFYPGFSMDTTRSCFHAAGKYCLAEDCVKHSCERLSRALADVSGPCSKYRSGPEPCQP